MYLRWRKADNLTGRVLKLFFVGSGIKFLGYLIVAIGVFVGFVNREEGLRIVVAGIMIVILGWLIIYKAYKLSKF